MGFLGFGGTSESSGKGERTLGFPVGDALGMLHARELGSPINARWRQVGPAEGKIVIPAGQEVMLQVRCETMLDFAFFARFRPNDFHTLDFLETKIQNKHLEHIRHFTSLTSLNLSKTQITDAGLEHIAGLEGLIVLTLYGTSITDAGLAHLRALPNLQTLWVNRTGVTDAGMEHLKDIKTLKEIYVADTRITDAGRDKLRESLPTCYVRTGKGSVWSY